MGRFLSTILVTVALATLGAGQQPGGLSLATAYELLEANYPALRNGAVWEQLYQTDLDLLAIARRPTLELRGEGRLQSENVNLQGGNELMPLTIERPLYSLKGYVEGNYLLYDGGLNEAQRTLKAAELALRQQDIAVAAYTLRQRINQIFTSVDLLGNQADLLTTSLAALAARREQVSAAVANGVALESELQQLAVQELELLRQQDQLAYQRAGLIATLGALIGRELPDDVVLELPELPDPAQIPELDRPEQERFDLQRELVLARTDLLAAERRPKVNTFAQAGVGAPNPLNFLEDNIAPFALVGVGAVWSITDWNKQNVSRQQLALQAQLVENEAATFAFNLDARVANYRAEVARLRAQIERTAAIATLQGELLEQVGVQLDEGVSNATDYLLQLNTELAARQQLSLYRAQLRKLQLDFWNERGGKL